MTEGLKKSDAELASAWAATQKKTFTKWCNNHLAKTFGRSSQLIADSDVDFETGILLMQLVHALYRIPMPSRYNKTPRMRPHLIDNINLALDMLEKQAGVKTNFLKPTHLADHDQKMILGMLWSIILDYQIKGISVEELSAKEGLLLWCQRKTAGYRDVKVDNFTTSWVDGLAFCALLHAHRPGCLDYAALDKANARQNLELAFSIAEQQLGIPRLLDVEDLVDTARPDERSVMTYISEWFHYFASQSQFDVAARRIARVLGVTQANDQLRADYAARAEALLRWVAERTAAMQSREFDNTLAGAQAGVAAFYDYKRADKPPRTAEKLAVEQLHHNISLKLRSLGRPAFVPGAGLGVADIAARWAELEEAERGREQAVIAELQRQLKLRGLVAVFEHKAAAFEQWAAKKSAFFAATEAEQFDSPDQVQVRLKLVAASAQEIEAAAPALEELRRLAEQLAGDRYERSAEVAQRAEGAAALFEGLRATAAQRNARLEAELARQRDVDAAMREFARAAKGATRWLQDEAEEARDHNFGNTLEAVRAYAETLAACEARLDAEYARRKAEVDAAAQRLAELGVSENRYTVLTVADVEARRQAVAELYAARVAAHAQELQRQEEMESRRVEFAEAAQEFVDFIAACKKAVAGAGAGEGEPEEHIAKANEAIAAAAEGEQRLARIDQLDQEMRAMGISHNAHTDLNMSILRTRWSQFQAFSKNYLATLEDELESKHKLQARLAQFAEHERIEGQRIEAARVAGDLNRVLVRVNEATTVPIVAKSVADVQALEAKLAGVSADRDAAQGDLAKLAEIDAQLAGAENPLAELTLAEAQSLYEASAGLIATRQQELAAESAKQSSHEELRVEFAAKANKLDAELDEQLRAIAETSGEPEAQLGQLSAIGNALAGRQGALEELAATNQALIDQQIVENPHTKLSFQDLEVKLRQAGKMVEDKRALLSSAIESKKGSQVSEEQLQELRESWQHFDHDNDGFFGPLEFKACLSSLGEDLTDEGVAAVFAKHGQNGQLPFQGYVTYMQSRLADSSSQSEIQESFGVIANGKGWVTEEELKNNFPAETVAYLLKAMPAGPEQGTYDYTKFTADIFSR
eukprot:m51a1_g1070 putative alpha actinin (1100) ;mRNA; r:849859-853784